VWADQPIDVDLFAGGMGGAYPDPFAVRATVSLSPTPTQVQLDLTGATYDTVVGGFGFSSGADPETPVTVYLDDLAWE
jgi:hypothetical protein